MCYSFPRMSQIIAMSNQRSFSGIQSFIQWNPMGEASRILAKLSFHQSDNEAVSLA